jgi:hypothetical protein
MLQELLPYIAGALQWARARRRFSEVFFIGIVAAASFAFYFVGHYPNALSVPLPDLLGGWWDQAKTILATTQVVSSGANILNSARGNSGPVPAGLPVTNSQP